MQLIVGLDGFLSTDKCNVNETVRIATFLIRTQILQIFFRYNKCIFLNQLFSQMFRVRKDTCLLETAKS